MIAQTVPVSSAPILVFSSRNPAAAMATGQPSRRHRLVGGYKRGVHGARLLV